MIKTVHKKCFNQIKVLFATVLVILSTYLPTYTYSHEIYSYPIRWYTKITEDGKTKLYLKANKDYLDQPFLETYTSSLSNWNNAWSASANYNIHSVSYIQCIDKHAQMQIFSFAQLQKNGGNNYLIIVTSNTSF